MDLIIVLIIIGLIVFFFRRFSSFIYAFAIIDIFLRIMTFLKDQLTKGDLRATLSRYIPASIPSILSKYSEGLLFTILLWLCVIAYIIFLTYLIKTFFRKKK